MWGQYALFSQKQLHFQDQTPGFIKTSESI